MVTCYLLQNPCRLSQPSRTDIPTATQTHALERLEKSYFLSLHTYNTTKWTIERTGWTYDEAGGGRRPPGMAPGPRPRGGRGARRVGLRRPPAPRPRGPGHRTTHHATTHDAAPRSQTHQDPRVHLVYLVLVLALVIFARIFSTPHPVVLFPQLGPLLSHGCPTRLAPWCGFPCAS